MAKAIEARRRELRLSPGEFAERAGVTRQGLAPLRRGERKAYQDRLAVAVCTVLGWTPDSIERLQRGEPAQLEVSSPGEVAELRAQLADLQEEVRRLAAVVATLGAAAVPSRARPHRAAGESR